MNGGEVQIDLALESNPYADSLLLREATDEHVESCRTRLNEENQDRYSEIFSGVRLALGYE